MKTQDLKNKPTDKLKGELKGLKVITTALTIVVSFLIIICIYGLVAKGNNAVFTPLLVVAFSTGSMIPLNYMNMKKIKKELESRGVN
ncbi:MAG: hypothetical protein ABJD66_00070 [Cellulophaga sp.]|uniref:hypothetical protein n=1 Tax=unclassified Cellulophaga TaxID=2634405 RepID=UPI0026E3EC3E|nr:MULTISPECIES: hypothetical protein [unclassified Cellulophaga]MDO6490984.1 hypothetical protein [Cellulophaga sp. 2_MG-2023]MDO6493822.1 hypothetical protein [Cellulophaga sp. 3_MG-2023]